MPDGLDSSTYFAKFLPVKRPTRAPFSLRRIASVIPTMEGRIPRPGDRRADA